MKIEETALPGVLMLSQKIYRDDRGAFIETWNQRAMEEAGLPARWVQDNFSVSKKNVLRGIHYQIVQPQGKLVRVAYGTVLDVAVDLRRSSSTFGRHLAVELTGESGQMLWIPEGFGHAFLVLSEEAGFSYKVTDYYSPCRGADDPLGRSGPCDSVARKRRYRCRLRQGCAGSDVAER